MLVIIIQKILHILDKIFKVLKMTPIFMENFLKGWKSFATVSNINKYTSKNFIKLEIFKITRILSFRVEHYTIKMDVFRNYF